MRGANSFAPIGEIVVLPEEFEVYGSLGVRYPKYKHLRIPVRELAQIAWR